MQSQGKGILHLEPSSNIRLNPAVVLDLLQNLLLQYFPLPPPTNSISNPFLTPPEVFQLPDPEIFFGSVFVLSDISTCSPIFSIPRFAHYPKFISRPPSDYTRTRGNIRYSTSVQSVVDWDCSRFVMFCSWISRMVFISFWSRCFHLISSLETVILVHYSLFKRLMSWFRLKWIFLSGLWWIFETFWDNFRVLNPLKCGSRFSGCLTYISKWAMHDRIWSSELNVL